jgi:hypothetical protein
LALWDAELEASRGRLSELAARLLAGRPVEEPERARALATLCERGPADASAWPAGLYLTVMWYPREPGSIASPDVARAVLAMAEGCLREGIEVRGWDWSQALNMLPDEVAPAGFALLAQATFGRQTGGFSDGDAGLSVLTARAASSGALVLDAMRPYLLDRGLCRARGPVRPLLERIGLDATLGWLMGLGDGDRLRAARSLAFLVEGPVLGEGAPSVPPLTEWLLTEYAEDEELFRAFLGGRRSPEVWDLAPPPSPERLRPWYEPYLAHGSRRVREWAEYEIGRAERASAR